MLPPLLLLLHRLRPLLLKPLRLPPLTLLRRLPLTLLPLLRRSNQSPFALITKKPPTGGFLLSWESVDQHGLRCCRAVARG